jgi:hypothetical protein
MRINDNKAGMRFARAGNPRGLFMRNVIKVAVAAGVLALSALSFSAPAAARDNNVGAYFGSNGFGIQMGIGRGNRSYYGTPYRNYASPYSSYSNYRYGSYSNYGYGSYPNYGYAPYSAYSYGAYTRDGRDQERWGRWRR